jgi:hypothetical protein
MADSSLGPATSCPASIRQGSLRPAQASTTMKNLNPAVEMRNPNVAGELHWEGRRTMAIGPI